MTDEQAPAWDEYERFIEAAWAEYQRVTAPALAEYKRVEVVNRAHKQEKVK